ncbi:GNAT family N-acetyltransferase [Listeria booriae]|uniref:GNAT family N-acetyltransferase n=1 Tax=Listeria booriae TaxID=1552123 RepID=UPI0016245815|nr:GNAT family N-acetyltransferase [Listeria booriae]MBC2369357.1 GNAT family N-acetyltransferase [Listeria booriae]
MTSGQETYIQPLSNYVNIKRELDQFDCDNESLNSFLKNEAMNYDKADCGRTWLLKSDHMIVGFFTLSASQTEIKKFFKKEKHRKGKHVTIYPCVHLSYFAIHKDYQNQGIGTALMKQVFKMVWIEISRFIGVNVMTVDAKAKAVNFYKKMGFETPTSRNQDGDLFMAITLSEIEDILLDT